MPEHYRGLTVVPSAGPLDAELVLVGESPAYHEEQQGQPFVGAAGRVLNKALQKAGIDRQRCRLVNLVPVRAPNDKFSNHPREVLEWGLQRFEAELQQLRDPKLIVALGNNPLRYTTGIAGSITDWRGSMLRPDAWPMVGTELAIAHPGAEPRRCAVLPTYHPAAVARQFRWIWPFTEDLQTAARYLRGDWQPPAPKRWYINRYDVLPDAIDAICRESHLVAIDTEMDPFWIIALATEDEVHAFAYDVSVRDDLKRLLSCPAVLKVAHNWNHDATFFHRVLGITPVGPFFDTMGAAHILDAEREKRLSPDIAGRFTSWPYHKWMVDYDPIVYCGMDAAVCADAYWPQIEALSREGLLEVANHDHKLLQALLDMQWEGVPIDEAERLRVEKELRDKLNGEESVLREMARPVIRSKLRYFKKPHLFYKAQQCKCCGGGKAARQQCWRCAGFAERPGKAALVGLYEKRFDAPPGKLTKAELEARLLQPCQSCGGQGKRAYWKPFNPDSPAQVADVVYRGLGIRPRTYKGSETVRVDRLQAIPDRPPLVDQLIKVQQIRADHGTVKRLQPGVDGKLHSVFDPWGTVSGRVASKEGLVEPGTNVQNIPDEGRRFVVAPPGYGLAYPDMEQIEARCVAVLGSEEKLIEIYRSGGDSHMKVMELIHDATGFDMNDVKVGPHAGEGRFLTKKSTYAFMYGVRPGHLAGELGIPEELAAEILQVMGRTFPGVKRYQLDVKRNLEATRMVRSPTGRRRRFLDRLWTLHERRVRDRDGRLHTERTPQLDYEVLKEAWSFAPQDMAATILAQGLFDIRRCHPWLVPIVHVHDALVLLFPLDRREEAIEAAVESLSRERWGMYFPAGMSIGPNWYVASHKDSWKRENGFAEWALK